MGVVKEHVAERPGRWRRLARVALFTAIICCALSGIGVWSYLRDASAPTVDDAVVAIRTGTADELALVLDRGLDPNTGAARPSAVRYIWQSLLAASHLGPKARAAPSARRPLLAVVGVSFQQGRARELAAYEKLKLLFDHGASLNAEPGLPASLMSMAVLGGDSRVVKLLLDHGVSANTVLPMSDTPLMLAVEINNLESTRLLLSRGANANAGIPDQWAYSRAVTANVGKYGTKALAATVVPLRSPMSCAHLKRNPEMIELLRSYGAK